MRRSIRLDVEFYAIENIGAYDGVKLVGDEFEEDETICFLGMVLRVI
jgi:hypothetical protein